MEFDMRRICLIVFLSVLTIACTTAHGIQGHNDTNVVMLGDSNTWIGGDDCDNPRGWNKWFRDLFAPATCRSYARSGATWTNTTLTTPDTGEYTEKLGDNNVIFNQINRLREAVAEGKQPRPDLIIVAAGTNDAWFEKSRPGAFSKTADDVFGKTTPDDNRAERITDRPANSILTLAEAVRYGCELLREAFPEATVVLLTPLQSVAVSTERIRLTGDIIESCGRRMGISVIRQDGDDFISRERESARRQMTTDGTHTSTEGARHNGTRIAEMVEALTQCSTI